MKLFAIILITVIAACMLTCLVVAFWLCATITKIEKQEEQLFI